MSINTRGGKYSATLKRMLVLKLADKGQKVPGDISSCYTTIHHFSCNKYLNRNMNILSTLQYVDRERCSLGVFRELLETRGWTREAQSK